VRRGGIEGRGRIVFAFEFLERKVGRTESRGGFFLHSHGIMIPRSQLIDWTVGRGRMGDDG